MASTRPIQGIIPAAVLLLSAASPASATIYAQGTEGPGDQFVELSGDFGAPVPRDVNLYLDVGPAHLLDVTWSLFSIAHENWWVGYDDTPIYLDGDETFHYFNMGLNDHQSITYGFTQFEFERLHYRGTSKTYGPSIDKALFTERGGKPSTCDNPFSVPFGVDCYLAAVPPQFQDQFTFLQDFTATSDNGFSWTLSDVRPAGIPEPAGWSLLIGGLGLAGAALRRRRGALLELATPPPPG
jgi:hypothetical protein